MRYLVQLIIPALIFVGVVYLLSSRRRDRRDQDPAGTGGSDTPAFIAILAISAVVALGTAYALVALWE